MGEGVRSEGGCGKNQEKVKKKNKKLEAAFWRPLLYHYFPETCLVFLIQVMNTNNEPMDNGDIQREWMLSFSSMVFRTPFMFCTSLLTRLKLFNHSGRENNTREKNTCSGYNSMFWAPHLTHIIRRISAILKLESYDLAKNRKVKMWTHIFLTISFTKRKTFFFFIYFIIYRWAGKQKGFICIHSFIHCFFWQKAKNLPSIWQKSYIWNGPFKNQSSRKKFPTFTDEQGRRIWQKIHVLSSDSNKNRIRVKSIIGGWE